MTQEYVVWVDGDKGLLYHENESERGRVSVTVDAHTVPDGVDRMTRFLRYEDAADWIQQHEGQYEVRDYTGFSPWHGYQIGVFPAAKAAELVRTWDSWTKLQDAFL